MYFFPAAGARRDISVAVLGPVGGASALEPWGETFASVLRTLASFEAQAKASEISRRRDCRVFLAVSRAARVCSPNLRGAALLVAAP